MSDAPSKYKKEILEAIEALRVRKTRPDSDRISAYCKKNLNVKNANDIKADLERLVDEDVVLKVEYEGIVSFRDARTWGLNHNMKDIHVQNSTITTERVIAAAELLSKARSPASTATTTTTRRSSPPSTSNGIAFEAIESTIAHYHPTSRLQGERLRKCLYREVDCGRLVELTNGCFVLADRVDHTMRIKREVIRMPPPLTSTALVVDRTAKRAIEKNKRRQELRARRKREQNQWNKDNFDAGETDPEWVNTPANKTKRPIPKVGIAKLDMALRKKPTRQCLECVDQRGPQIARAGVLLECTSCSYATHPGCGGYSAETVAALDGNYKCMQCKRCAICDTGILGDDPDLVVCVRCDSSFHLNCHTPPVSLEQASKEWRCEDCKSTKNSTSRKAVLAERRMKNIAALRSKRLHAQKELVPEKVRSKAESAGRNQTSTQPSDPDRNLFGALSKRDLVIRAVDSYCDSLPPRKTPELVQEIVAWSVDDVAAKFEGRQLPDFAASMRAQCIDGAALMLLTRDDIVSRFGLNLVPALKLYREVCTICPFGPYTDWN